MDILNLSSRFLADDFQMGYAFVERVVQQEECFEVYTVYFEESYSFLIFLTTITGRRRYLPEIFSKDPGVRAGAERQAFNTRIQGSAADIIKIAMVRAHTMLPKQAKITLTVHDELVVTTPDNLVDETVSKLREAMEGINVLKVPLIADITVSKRWGDAK